MLKTLLLAGAVACLPLAASAQECLTIAGFADYLNTSDTTAEIIEVVPVNSQSVDNLLVFRAENGNVLMIPEFKGCMFGQPILIDVARQEADA